MCTNRQDSGMSQKMNKFIALAVVIVLHASFRSQTEVTEDVKNKMFCCACANAGSTSKDYVVVKVKSLRTGETKEMCLTLNMLSGALSRENGKPTFGIDCKNYPTRYFEFSKDSALWNIGFNEYSSKELVAFRNKLNPDSIVKKIKARELTSVYFRENERYFAHIMFNMGVVTTRGCFGTSVACFNPALPCE